MRRVNRGGHCDDAATATKANAPEERRGMRREEARGATRCCESESVSMFYSCRAFPVSGNNGGHGSPLPALLGLSLSLSLGCS